MSTKKRTRSKHTAGWRRTSIHLPPDVLEWIDKRLADGKDETQSALIRRCLREAKQADDLAGVFVQAQAAQW